jgi:hypothetical protein
MELLGGVGHVESCFGLFGNCVSVGVKLVHGCTERTIGSETILDTVDGTPR